MPPSSSSARKIDGMTMGARVIVTTTGLDAPPRCRVSVTGVPVRPRIRLET